MTGTLHPIDQEQLVLFGRSIGESIYAKMSQTASHAERDLQERVNKLERSHERFDEKIDGMANTLVEIKTSLVARDADQKRVERASRFDIYKLLGTSCSVCLVFFGIGAAVVAGPMDQIRQNTSRHGEVTRFMEATQAVDARQTALIERNRDDIEALARSRSGG
ncbi:hypothetical protein ACSMXM_01375 [Pacificimonas sp. ICDLI1SI03]